MEKKQGKQRVRFGKWLENFWYYYKWHTIAIIVVAIGVAIGIGSCVNGESVDLCIYYLSKDPLVYSEDKINLLHSLEPYVEDFDGDGEVRLELRNYYVGDEDTVESQLEQFRNEYIGGGVMLLLADETGVEQLVETGWLGNITDIAPDAAFDGVAWNAEGSAYRDSEYLKDWQGEMFFGLRVFDDKSMIRILSGKEEQYEYAKQVLTNIIQDNQVGAVSEDVDGRDQ